MRHTALIDLCFSSKRVFIERQVRITLAEPRLVGNLQTECREIVEEREEASKSQQDFYQADEGAADAQKAAAQESADEAAGDVFVDPEDPLYGLEQRLRNMNLDEESRRIIRDKLEEANNKVKQALEDRQKNLDTKLAGGAGAAAAKKK